ncbi:glycosyltransferase family 2 protein [Oceaniglobus ichthyenteri]|uniref:glycosyltransferase family 2 protein n=1 Tax=Oceaniglobus ichthyenteri TaxID=2136177 RepID=UPI000D3CA4CC|nr:glycosyltransferase family 2 protein [Oceaniglobus ichthyenteri]
MATLLTILLNYKTAPMTLRAAKAALADMTGIEGELIIVDNDSGDGSFELLRDAAETRGWTANNRVRVIQAGQNGGFGAGNNVGLRAGFSDGSAPDFYYILNSDAFPDPGCIPALIEFLQATPKAGFAGSHVRGEDGVPHCTAFRFPSILGEFEGAVRTGIFSRLLKNSIVALPIPDTATQVDWVAGASLMIRRKALEDIGLFDETFFLYFEETDLARRAAKADWQTWYVPHSRVVHIGSVSTGMKTWARMPEYWFQSRRHYFRKNHGRTYAALATLSLIKGAALWRLRCALTGRKTQDPKGFLRDLITFSLGLPLGRPSTSAKPMTALSEDSK